ncbi:GTPase [Lacinutrix sp.]|uniref:GTPase n=1 Tax=Lacinutrix sp. TaxID=1937692 RepID=UPI0025BEEF6C|nr:GTPase [Lacinutrix sp.]
MNKLIFVYNANSGIGNTLLDVAHKIFSPKTYNCNLCAITFDTFSENKNWKAFRIESNVNMEFLHIDEFEKLHPKTDYNYPIILTEDKNELSVFLLAEELNTIHSTEALIKEIKNRIV